MPKPLKHCCRCLLILALALIHGQAVLAQQDTLPNFERCLLLEIQQSSGDRSVADIRSLCRQKERDGLLLKSFDDGESVALDPAADKTAADDPADKPMMVSSRFNRERLTEFDPYTITPHRLNYILPALLTDQVNPNAYTSIPEFDENFTRIETKFQLSFKTPLNYRSLFLEGDALYLAFTVEAWWQVFSDEISKPFRETNYRPELFYIAPLPYRPFGSNTGFTLGAEHQSNGRGRLLSRSWNRIYASLLFEKDNYTLYIKPWWRVPEEADEFPGDPDGDDNPDIGDFMGHFELGGAYKWRDYELSVKARRSFRTTKGAVELGLTFPLWAKLRGFVYLFDGYGESLIDYNHSQTRFGLGVALNDIL